MPTYRIVYIDDDTFAPRTLTAAFPSRAAVEIAMAKHGHRVVHIADMKVGENAADPIELAMPLEGEKPSASERLPRRAPATATHPLLGLPRYDLAGVAVVAAGIAVAGAAYLLF
jgi:hypothetical protein